jgi:hypothetical protein
MKNLFKKVWEGFTKTPPKPGADCEGLINIQYYNIYFKSRFRNKKFLNMLGTAAEGEENQRGDGPQLQYSYWKHDLKRVNISVKAMVGR